MSSILSGNERLLFLAITREGPEAAEAFRTWRKRVPLDDIGAAAFRITPLLVEVATRHGLVDPDLERMRGIGRHIWTANQLQLRQLFSALTTLEGAGVRPLLMKGAALFARFPALSSKRMAFDYDFLVPPDDLPRAAEVLAAAGYQPESCDWETLRRELVRGGTSGIGLVLGGKPAKIDFHWRPLWNLRDPAFTDRLFAGAEEIKLQGRPVLVPSLTHHLFLAVARCEPYDREECLQRLIEGFMLLRDDAGELDREEFVALVLHYRLQAIAAAYLKALAEIGGLTSVAPLAARLETATGLLDRLELRLRATAPERRRPLVRWFTGERDRRNHRASEENTALGLGAAAALELPALTPGRLAKVRRELLRHHAGPSTGSIRFLEGWHYPEAAGRWSEWKLAALAVPLTAAQRAGAPISLHVQGYARKWRPLRVSVNAGGLTHHYLLNGRLRTLEVAAKPVEELGGDALVVFWISNAASPSDDGGADLRTLGVFVPAPASTA